MASKRPRGFIYDWKPKPHVVELIRQVSEIIDSSTILPLTLRQIFYIMVSRYGFEKTNKAYKRMCEAMNRARRAQMVNMDSIRDDGLIQRSDAGWYSMNGFLKYVKKEGVTFELNRQEDQYTNVYVWCEAGGMVPQLLTAVREWHVPVLSSGGFDSVTTKHNFAREISENNHTVILHLGDHDPSGVHMCSSLDEDLTAFVDHYGGWVDLKRIAVTPDQVEEMSLPTSPPKGTDNRSFEGLTTQCEAIDPVDLRQIVQDEVSLHIDTDTLDETHVKELEIREQLKKKFKDLI